MYQFGDKRHMGAGRRTGLRFGWGTNLVGSGDQCVRGKLSCIDLGDRAQGLISGKRQQRDHIAPVESLVKRQVIRRAGERRKDSVRALVRTAT